jgi:hypothetical protein
MGRLVQFALAFAVLVTPLSVSGFDLPDRDPWYHQDDSHADFWIPDKAQHYWGSQFLGKLADQIPMTDNEWTKPILALGAGFIWEIYQDQQGVGFSERDMVANILGVVSSQVNNDDVVVWLQYSTEEDVIVWNVTWRF